MLAKAEETKKRKRQEQAIKKETKQKKEAVSDQKGKSGPNTRKHQPKAPKDHNHVSHSVDGSRHTLYITGLPYTATEEEISSHFGDKCQVRGPTGMKSAVLSCRVLYDKTSGQSRGICFLDVMGKTGLEEGLKLNNSGLSGRSIVVRKALDKSALNKQVSAVIK